MAARQRLRLLRIILIRINTGLLEEVGTTMTRTGRTRLLGVAAALTSVLAMAQNTPDSNSSAVPTKTLPKVMVSADEPESYEAQTSTSLRTDTLLRDEPTSVTVVTRKLIDDQNMQNLADVVRYVPGVGIAQGEGNRDNPVFRGSSTSGDLFIDGLRDDVEYYRDLYNIEQVEVLKGPNGMLFGRGGVGGVINRVSKRGWIRYVSIGGATGWLLQ